MTEKQLATIEARAKAANDIFDWKTVYGEDVPALVAEVQNLKTRILDLERTFKHCFVPADYHGYRLRDMCAYCGFELEDNLHFAEATND